jgi:ribonuclease HI
MQEAQTFLRQNGASSSNSASSSLPASIDRVALNTTMMVNETTNRGTKRPHPDALGTAPLHHAHQPLLPTTVTTTTTTTSKQNSNHRIRIIIYFDGGSRGNPGVAGAGAQVIVMEEGQSIKHETTTATSNNLDIDNNTKEYHIRKYCGEHATNNYAEYSGLLSGLEVAKSYIDNVCKHASEDKSELPSINLAVYGDSNLVIQQMRGVWKCTHANIRPLFNQCNTIIFEMKECAAAATGRECRQLSGKSSSIVITYEHIRRNLNGVADGESDSLCG